MTLQALVCLVLGLIALILITWQFIRGRRAGSAHSTKRFVLGLFVVPVLLVAVWLYLGQFQIILGAS